MTILSGRDAFNARPDTIELPAPYSQIRIEDIADSSVVDGLAGYSTTLGQQQQSPGQMLHLSAAQEFFVASTRNAVLSQDLDSAFTRHKINPVVLQDHFVVKAINFMEMCQGRIQQSGRGHIKIDQAFRNKGTFVEGWIFVRWMEVGWGTAGFKAHRLGSLPLVTFHRKDKAADLQGILDRLMQEVYPVLVECFPECDVVAVQSCEESWYPTRTSRVGSEVFDALQRAAAGASSISVTTADESSTIDVPGAQTETSRAAPSLNDAIQRGVKSASRAVGDKVSKFEKPQTPVGTSIAGSDLKDKSKGHDGGLRLSCTSVTERDSICDFEAPHAVDGVPSSTVDIQDVESAICVRVEDTNQSQRHCQPSQWSVPPVHAFAVWAVLVLTAVVLALKLA
jgi:hypothetical protein